jgi:hypothetical protein
MGAPKATETPAREETLRQRSRSARVFFELPGEMTSPAHAALKICLLWASLVSYLTKALETYIDAPRSESGVSDDLLD